MEIDIEKLRKTLVDYYGSGCNIMPSMFGELIKIENCSDAELIKTAKKEKINLDKYYRKIEEGEKKI